MAIAAAAILTIVLIVVFLPKGPVSIEKQKKQNFAEIQGPWRQSHHPFDPKRCLAGKCKEMLRLPPIANQGVSIKVDPEIDDEVAQWSDCLASITQCADQLNVLTVQGFHKCVSQSVCPVSCKQGFGRKVRHVQDINGMLAEFNAYFVDEGGACVPR